MKKTLLIFFLLCAFIMLHAEDLRKEFLVKNYPDHKVKMISQDSLYLLKGDKENLKAFFTDKFSSARGYVGPVILALIVDENVTSVRDILLFSHNETPGFFRMAENAGIITAHLSAGVDNIISGQSGISAVSGATFTSDAIITAIRETITLAKADVPNKSAKKPPLMLLMLTVIVILAGLLAVYLKKPILRYISFALYIGFFPVFLGRILSLNYIIGYLPSPVILTPIGLLAAFILILSFFKNRPYCFYMCPVGLLSQLGCKVKSKKCTFRDNRTLRLMSFLLFNILYLLGFVYFTVFPFMAFVTPYNPLKIIMIIAFAVVSIFLPYIWCNNLCPLGTLFSIQFDLGRILKGAIKRSKKG